MQGNIEKKLPANQPPEETQGNTRAIESGCALRVNIATKNSRLTSTLDNMDSTLYCKDRAGEGTCPFIGINMISPSLSYIMTLCLKSIIEIMSQINKKIMRHSQEKTTHCQKTKKTELDLQTIQMLDCTVEDGKGGIRDI